MQPENAVASNAFAREDGQVLFGDYALADFDARFRGGSDPYPGYAVQLRLSARVQPEAIRQILGDHRLVGPCIDDKSKWPGVVDPNRHGHSPIDIGHNFEVGGRDVVDGALPPYAGGRLMAQKECP
jgi:hypothetical protein